MRCAISFLLALVASFNASADFSYENDEFGSVSLNYRMALINQLPDDSGLTVIYLHGGSGRGDDNETQMQTEAVDDIFDYLSRKGLAARLLVPQSPDDCRWEGEMIAAVKALADRYSAAGGSVYVLGGSMGGYGVWNLLEAYPGYFTGAMPVACNTPRVAADRFAATRICSVVGGEDPQRNIAAIRSFFARLAAVDGKGARLDVEDDWNHRETCEWSFTADRLDWLFSVEDSSVGNILCQPTAADDVFDLNGRHVVDPKAGSIYIVGGQKVARR